VKRLRIGFQNYFGAISEQLRNDRVSVFRTISKRFRRDYTTIVELLRSDCGTVSRRLRGDCAAIAQQLRNDRKSTAK
jgi:hypothetical protein